jgi:hypothetical protein
MPTDASHGVKFEIEHVLFIEIVGSSKMLITQQGARCEKRNRRENIAGASFNVARGERKAARFAIV